MMSSSDEVAQLEAWLQKVKADKAACKATEKAAAEAKRIAEEKVAAEVKRIAEEKAAVEAKRVEERRQAELEERRWAVATAKAQEEAEGRWIAEELVVAAAAKPKAVLAVVETAAEKAETEQAVGMPAKQKGQAEGERLACDRCATRGFDCQVSPVVFFLWDFSDKDGR